MTETITISNEKEESKYYTYDDLQAVIKRGGKGIPINKIYDPEKFWDSMGDKFYKAFDKPEKCGFGVEYFIDRLKQFGSIESMLEVGCGFARLAPFFLQSKIVKNYTGVDISQGILKCSEIYLDPTVKEDSELKNVESFFSNGNLSEETKNLISKDVHSLLETIKKKSEEKASKDKPDFRPNIKLIKADIRKLPFDSESFDTVISSECLQHLNLDDALDSCREMARVTKDSIIMLERWAFPSEHSEPHIWSHNYSEIFTELGLNIVQVTTISAGLQGIVVRKR